VSLFQRTIFAIVGDPFLLVVGERMAAAFQPPARIRS
jgi:hypothetical protein